MNRQIKFRGKRTDNGEWVYGYLVHDNVIGAKGIAIGTVNLSCECKIDCNGYRVISETVGQFTGLLDKNGKEIYEGDIIDSGGSVGDVQFDCGVFGVEWTHHKKDRTFVGSWGQRHNLRKLDDDLIECIEVVGNIHDNSDLLTTKKEKK